jgi:hypothetical protein
MTVHRQRFWYSWYEPKTYRTTETNDNPFGMPICIITFLHIYIVPFMHICIYLFIFVLVGGDEWRPDGWLPHPNVLGVLCSGETRTSDIMVALVEAFSSDSVRNIILTDWTQAGEERFCEPVDATWTPGERFPLTVWMTEQIEQQQHQQDSSFVQVF